MNAQRRFAPTFSADVVMGDGPVARGRTADNRNYIKAQGVSVAGRDGSPRTATIMSFGPRSAAIADLLVPGVPVRLQLRRDGGALIAIAPANDAAPAPAPKAAKPARMSAAMLAACVDAGGFAEHAAY